MEPKVERAERAIQESLRDLSGATVKITHADSSRFRAAIRAAGRTYRVTLVWAGQGWPSEVRRAVSETRRPWPREMVVAATNLSSGALELLREADANWVDESGRTRLIVPPGLSILREIAQPPKVRKNEDFRWSRSAIEVAEFVLHSNLSELKTGDLAKATGWSAGQISQILGGFESLGWTDRRGGRSGRQSRHELVKPGVLLDSWADELSRAVHHKRLGHRTDRDLLRFAHEEIGPLLGERRHDWALTAWAGLELIAPYATSTPILHIYVEKKRFVRELDRVMRTAQIREVNEGARIEFWKANFKLLTQPGKPHPLPIASSPRIYADLLRLGGRAADAAQHLRETVLGY